MLHVSGELWKAGKCIDHVDQAVVLQANKTGEIFLLPVPTQAVREQ